MKWAVLLAGGSGTRFWPLSTRARPKQLLPLASDRSSAEDAVARLDGLIPPERILIVTSRLLAPVFARTLGLPSENVLPEPQAASTAPALAWAAWVIAQRDPDAVLLSTHSDWFVPNPDAFRAAAAAALDAASGTDRLVTVGIVPTRVETGYGHIIPGEPLDGGLRSVRRFVEKPEAGLAETLMANGALWNSGLFAWTAGRFLAEVRACAPGLDAHLQRLAAKAGSDDAVAEFFREVAPEAVDTAVLERSDRMAVVEGRFDWDDIGNWNALFRLRPRDARGNIGQGPVYFGEGARGVLAWSDGVPIVVDGMQDCIVVAANGRMLVIPRARAAELKSVIERLPPDVRNL